MKESTRARSGAAAIVTAMAALVAVSSSAIARAADLQTRHEFRIPAQALDTALLAFSDQAKVQVLMWAGAQADARSRGATGELSALVALKAILDSTGFTFQQVDGETVAIVKAGTPAKAVTDGLNTGARSGSLRLAEVSSDTPAVLEEIVVTGSHIRGEAPVGSALTIYDRQRIDETGAASVAAFVRTLPQNFSLIDSGTSVTAGNPAAGTNSFAGTGFNLHGAGAGATLVLVNDHRLAPAGFDGSFFDISMIPLSAVESVEILGDGASAIYGADAIAGVVNFKLRKDFDGFETSGTAGTSTRGGGTEYTASQLAGTGWSSGSSMFSYDYSKEEGIRADDRDFVPASSILRNFNLTPDQDRHSAFLNVRQALGSRTELSADALYSRRRFDADSSTTFAEANTTGESELLGSTLALSVALPGDWHAAISAIYSRLNQSSVNETVGVGLFPVISRSQIAGSQVSLDGGIFTLPGGEVRAAAGVDFRTEKFGGESTASSGKDLSRDVYAAFGELLIPIVGRSNSLPFVRDLQLSLAGRYDHYSDFGSAFGPKVGVRWSPANGLSLRSSYARSFRAPTLSQLTDIGRTFFIFPIPNSAVPEGSTNTLVLTGQGNPSLTAERSSSFTAGIDWTGPARDGFQLSLSYFDVSYKRQIAAPPLPGGDLAQIFDGGVDLSPYLSAVTQAEVARVIAQENFLDFFGIGASEVGVLFDNRPDNLAHTTVRGLETNITHELSVRAAELRVFLGGQYLIDNEVVAAPGFASVQIANRLFQPARLRLRGGASAGINHWSASYMLNYVGSYRNTLSTPESTVSSWLTADLQLACSFADTGSGLDGLRFALTAVNLFDRAPPHVGDIGASTPFGFDSINASPLGRFVTLQITKKW